MKSPLILTLSALSMLAACGGGDGGGNNDAGGPPASGGNISSANAASVTAVSYQSAMATASLGDAGSSTGLFAAGPSGATKIDGSFATANKAGGGSAGIPIPPTVDNCIPSGTMTVSGDIADPFTPTLTPDDFFDVIFDMCNDGATVTHGDLHFIVDAFSGDFLGGMYDLTMTATFTSFQVTTSDDTLTSNGDATIQLNNLSLSAITVQSSGAMLTIDRNSSSETQTNFSTTQIVNAQDPMLPYTLTTAGTLDSTQLTFVVDYSTPTEFAGFGADYPGSGVFLVSDGMSSATLTAIDNVNVRIDIDTDNNGMVDDTINTTWAALEGG